MKVIIAPEPIDPQGTASRFRRPTVFLGGGIANCPNWQDEVINLLWHQGRGIILNPRRENFPINDAAVAKEQITWEFHALNNADVFSMWFCNTESDQPICMYELGRHVALLKNANRVFDIVIGVESGYRRSQDVLIQMQLVDPVIAIRISNDLETHAMNIANVLRRLR